jgi:hypothetical protein
MDIIFYGLLHLSENESNGGNLNAENFSIHKNFYLKNAITLAASLKSRGIKFVLLTNRIDELQSDIVQLGMHELVEIESIPFCQNIPSGIEYYSAHFKLDVFNYFANKDEQSYLALLDLDMIAVSEVPQCFCNVVEAGIPMHYDISDQEIPRYGEDLILKSIEQLLGESSEGRWSGGEFISGTPSFFQRLAAEVHGICLKYVENPEKFHHQGDEMITSVALEKLRRQGIYIADAGTMGIVGRFFSVPTPHPQKSFDYFRNCFLLHLPVDKQFLANVSVIEAQRRNLFLESYEMHLKAREIQYSTKFHHRLKRKLDRELDRIKKFPLLN